MTTLSTTRFNVEEEEEEETGEAEMDTTAQRLHRWEIIFLELFLADFENV